MKSPSVLKPVFNFAKKEYKERGKKVDTLSYDNWLKNNLKIEFKKGTEILNISFKDINKAFILDTLNLIKIKYEDYSKRDRLLALKNTKIT